MAGHCPVARRHVKKVDKQDKKQRRSTSSGRDIERDWRPVLHRLHDAIEWALDIAVTLAGDIDEDIEAIERTREYARAWTEGRVVDVDMRDVLTTLAILFAAIELNLGLDGSPAIEARPRREPRLYLPGARFPELPAVVIRRAPRYRNVGASAFPTHLAA
jgi:hypothetical protein